MKKLLVFVLSSLSACSVTPHRGPITAAAMCEGGAPKDNSLSDGGQLEYLPASYHRGMQASRLRHAQRGRSLYFGASMAGLNNPVNPSGDVDNVAVSVGGKLSLNHVSLRPEMQLAERSNAFNATVTRDFTIAGNGVGAIEGNLGVGYSAATGKENNVLGNSNTAFLRMGAEGYLVGNIVTGVALMIAPWGYNGDSTAIAGVGYFGFSF